MALLDLTFYPVLPQGEPLPNDDLDLQLVWLHALEQHGPRLTSAQLGQEWVEHVRFPFDEYGYALYNLRRHIQPPVSGWFGNPFTDCMGAPIRSEIWAMIAPGLPKVAAYYAWHDAVVDHAGGEGVWGEVLFAAIQSAAFVESEPLKLIETGLQLIPAESRVAMAVRDLLAWHAQGVDWQEARERILEKHGRANFTDAPQNIAFTLLGWLYGEDFGDALLKAVNCGYDTDCTAATLGAILGLVMGAKAIPERWREPVGNKVVLSPAIIGIDPPQDLYELTQRTLRIAHETCAAWGYPRWIGERVCESGDQVGDGDVDAILKRTFGQRPTAFTHRLPVGTTGKTLQAQHVCLSVTVDYGADGPAISEGGTRPLWLKLANGTKADWEGTVSLRVPPGWSGPEPRVQRVVAGESVQWQVEVTHGGAVEPFYQLRVELLSSGPDGLPWQAQSFDVALVPAWSWTLTSPSGEAFAVESPTTYVPFHQVVPSGSAGSPGDQPTRLAPGWWRAKTVLFSPEDQELQLIVATELPFKLALNDETHLDSQSPRDFMPAYHRPPHDSSKVVRFQKGLNELVIDVMFDDKIKPVVVAAVNPTPGLQHPDIRMYSVRPQAASAGDA